MWVPTNVENAKRCKNATFLAGKYDGERRAARRTAALIASTLTCMTQLMSAWQHDVSESCTLHAAADYYNGVGRDVTDIPSSCLRPKARA